MGILSELLFLMLNITLDFTITTVVRLQAADGRWRTPTRVKGVIVDFEHQNEFEPESTVILLN